MPRFQSFHLHLQWSWCGMLWATRVIPNTLYTAVTKLGEKTEQKLLQPVRDFGQPIKLAIKLPIERNCFQPMTFLSKQEYFMWINGNGIFIPNLPPPRSQLLFSPWIYKNGRQHDTWWNILWQRENLRHTRRMWSYFSYSYEPTTVLGLRLK